MLINQQGSGGKNSKSYRYNRFVGVKKGYTDKISFSELIFTKSLNR